MKEFILKGLVGLFILLGAFPVLQAQDCTDKLQYAKQLSDSGKIEEIPSLLEGCLLNGFTNSQKIEAYRLLIQSYLFDENREAARKQMDLFLKDFPEYSEQEGDPVEFVKLLKTYRIEPIWDYGFSVGSNVSQILVNKQFSTQSLNTVHSSYSSEGVGVDLNLRASRYFSKHLRLSASLGYSLQHFSRKETGVEVLTYKERDHWINIPVEVQYIPLTGKISPYVFAGAEVGWLLSAKSDIARHNLTSASVVDLSQKSADVSAFRQSVNAWGYAGLGVQYKRNGTIWFLQAGYNYQLLPFVNDKMRYSDNERLFYYQYIDDDFRVNRISFSVGYAKLIYRNTKKTARNGKESN
jgi:hypothetical protein